jgi:flagellar biosynthetic protein FliR
MMLKAILTLPAEELLVTFMMLCRTSGVFLLVPPFGDTNVKPMMRVMISLSICLLIQDNFSDIIRPFVRSIASDNVALTMTIFSELFIGISFAIIVKTLISGVQVAGLTIASQMGLSAASLFDPSQQLQNSSFGLLLSILVTLAILKSDMYMQVIGGIYESYNKIPIGGFFNVYDDFTKLIIGSVAKMWSVGIQISMPFILINIAIMIGGGILAKLMPQLQIFFVILPVQIIVGIIVFSIILSGMLLWFLNFLSSEINLIF